MYDDSSIKISKEAERINEIERLKRRFNNVNNDSSMSCENNSYLNTSMLSVSVQNTTSFENENSAQNSQHIIDTNKSINMIPSKNQNKVSQIVNKIDELIKLKSGKKRPNESKIDKNNINKKFEINFKKNQANLKQNRKESQNTPSTSVSKGKSFKFLPEAKAQQANKIEINNINNRFVNKNQNENHYNNSITNLDQTPKYISTPNSGNNSNFKSEPTRNIMSNLNRISKSNFDSSHLNTIVTDKTDTTQILQMNNIHTDKLITKGFLLRNNSHHSDNSSNADNISLIKFVQKQALNQSLEIENEHSILNEKFPSENEKEIDEENVNNAVNSMGSPLEKIRTSTYFANVKKSYTKDTEVIRGDVEDNNSYIKKQLTFLTTRSLISNSILNTLERENIFYNNPNWLLSNRLINDEKNYFNRQVTIAMPDYKFLGKIREDSRSAVAMRTKYFISLSEDAMFNLLSYIYDQYKILTKINKFIERKICLTMNNKFERVVNSFRNNYIDIFELQEFYFNHSEVKRSNSNSYEGSVIDLVLKSKIVSKLVNKCIELSFVHKTNGKEYLQTWSFDLRKKNDIAIWFASEAEENIKRIKRTCYYQPIISFAKDDYIEFRINIFSQMGCIDPSSIKWMEIITYDTPEHTFLQFEKSLIKSNVEYDKLRCCELENVIHVWKNEKSLSRKENISDFKKVFKNHFKILSVYYDIAKFYIYKIRMKANCLGIVRKNKFANVDIEIKPWDEAITNETQCLGLLNVSHLSNKVEIRKSTVVYFYFTDLYL